MAISSTAERLSDTQAVVGAAPTSPTIMNHSTTVSALSLYLSDECSTHSGSTIDFKNKHIYNRGMKRRKYPQFKTKKKSCTGKVQYTRKEAFENSKTLSGKTGERLHSYKCNFCTHFHVGHMPSAIAHYIDNK